MQPGPSTSDPLPRFLAEVKTLGGEGLLMKHLPHPSTCSRGWLLTL